DVSLVKIDPFEEGTAAVTVHRLVQAAASTRSEARNRGTNAVVAVMNRLAAVFPKIDQELPGSWPIGGRLVQHVLRLRKLLPVPHTLYQRWYKLLDRTGSYFVC